MDEKKIFLIFCVTVFCLLSGVAAISYVGDPAGLFKGEPYFRSMVDILHSGNNVTNYSSNFDQGKFKSLCISQDSGTRNVLVLGSSLVADIDSSMVDKENKDNPVSFMNDAVSSGKIGDTIGLFELYAERNAIPKTIILGLDSWFFNPRDRDVEYNSLADAFDQGKIRIGYSNSSESELGKWVEKNARYKELISRPYFFASLKYLSRGEGHQPAEVSATQKRNHGTDWIRNQDGTWGWPDYYYNGSSEAVDAIVEKNLLNSPLQMYGGFYEVKAERVKLFETFILYLKKKGVHVVFYLSPIHPGVYQRILSDPLYELVLRQEQYFRRFASENNIPVIGSYDPCYWNLTSSDYFPFDSYHLRPEAVARIFETGPVTANRISYN